MTSFIIFNALVELLCANLAIFVLAFFFATFYTTNFIRLLLNIEVMVLVSNLNFIIGSFLLDDMLGQIFVLFVLSIVAAESAIGLAIFILYYRIYSTISLYSLTIEKLDKIFNAK